MLQGLLCKVRDRNRRTALESDDGVGRIRLTLIAVLALLVAGEYTREGRLSEIDFCCEGIEYAKDA